MTLDTKQKKHVTRDIWHVTCDTWHTGGSEHCLKISALTVWDIQSFEDISTNHQLIIELIIYLVTEVFVEQQRLHRVFKKKC